MSRPSGFVTDVRNASTNLLEIMNRLQSLRREWDALGYSGTLDAQGAFEPPNDDVTEAEIAAVIGTTLDALNALLAQGHATNLYKLLY